MLQVCEASNDTLCELLMEALLVRDSERDKVIVRLVLDADSCCETDAEAEAAVSDIVTVAEGMFVGEAESETADREGVTEKLREYSIEIVCEAEVDGPDETLAVLLSDAEAVWLALSSVSVRELPIVTESEAVRDWLIVAVIELVSLPEKMSVTDVVSVRLLDQVFSPLSDGEREPVNTGDGERVGVLLSEIDCDR
jgi:hypothetical protein